MSKLPDDLLSLLNDIESAKVVGTIDDDGIPHLVVKGSLTTLDNETIVFVEGFEGSLTNENLISSVRLNKKVAINITKGLISYQVKGFPHKYLTTDAVFTQLLNRIRERRGPDATIAGVWGVNPDEIRNESPGYRSSLAKEENGIRKNPVEQEG